MSEGANRFGCVEAAIWISELLEMLLKDPEHPD